MIDCAACEAAEASRTSGRVNANCPDCRARDLGKSPVFFEARARCCITPAYQFALERIGIDGEHYSVTHERVNRWARGRE